MSQQNEQIKAMHTFGLAIESALNDTKLLPVEGHLCAVMYIVAPEPEEEGGELPAEPLGGSVNYDNESGKWEMMTEISQSQPYRE